MNTCKMSLIKKKYNVKNTMSSKKKKKKNIKETRINFDLHNIKL